MFWKSGTAGFLFGVMSEQKNLLEVCARVCATTPGESYVIAFSSQRQLLGWHGGFSTYGAIDVSKPGQ